MLKFFKIVLTLSGAGLVLLGVGLFAYDAWFNARYGFHWDDVAGITEDGQSVDWPTGEAPLISLRVYCLGFCFGGVLLLLFKYRLKEAYRGRILRGTE